MTISKPFSIVLVFLLCVGVTDELAAQDYSHCDGSDVTPSDHGTLTLGQSADSLARSENATAINTAISNAPVQGTVCLPNDSVFTTWDVSPGGKGMVRISRDSITVTGAGACGWGDDQGCTFIGTPGNGEISDTLSQGNIGHKYPYVDEGSNQMYKGHGISFEVDGEVARHITIEDMKMSTGLDHTGKYGFGGLANQIYEWDRENKGIDFRNTNGTNNEIRIEDVEWRGYRGEVIYHGGLGMQQVIANRVKAHESNASAWNVPAADSQVVKNSEFGPDVRFWAEMQAELYPNAYSMHRGNKYVGCRTNAGCIAMAADTESNSVDGMEFVWRNNTFDFGGKRGVLHNRSNAEVRFEDNKMIDGDPYIYIGLSKFSEVSNLQIHNNDIDASGVSGVSNLIVFTDPDNGGRVTRNTLTDVRLVKLIGDDKTNHQMVIAGNTVQSNTQNGVMGFEGLAESAATGPLIKNNIYTHPTVGFTQSWFAHDGNIHMAAEELYPDSDSRAYELDTLSASRDGATYEISATPGSGGEVTLPADSVEHTWTSDVSIADGPNQFVVEYDSVNKEFHERGWIRPADSLSENPQWDGGSIAGPDTIMGNAVSGGVDADDGYFRHRALGQDVDLTGTYGVKAEIDSVDSGTPSPFAHASVRLADADTTGANSIQLECARFGYCRVTWRKGGTLTKAQWEQITPRFVRVLTDGTDAWVEHDADLDGTWEMFPNSKQADDKVTIDLSASPHAGVGVDSGSQSEGMMAIIEDIGIISPN